VADYLARMESLRLAANRSLMLGLFDYEAHFARYRQGTSTPPIATPSPGDPTAAHLGVLPEQRLAARGGGMLRVYDDDEQFLMDVSPGAGGWCSSCLKSFPTRCCPQAGALQHCRLVSGQRQWRRAGRSPR
jgi:SM-20-related protein